MTSYLYNPWTNIKHGHARSELIMAKKLLIENDYSCEILSTSLEFGDSQININNNRSFDIPKWLQRGPIFRFSNKRYKKQEAKSLLDYLKLNSGNMPYQVVITSARSDLLSLVKEDGLGKVDFKIRLIELPKSKESIFELRDIADLPNVLLAIETSDASAALEKLGIRNVLTVPPIQGLIPEDSRTLGKRVGLLWPVSYEETEYDFRLLMDSIRDFEAIVRLPGNFEGKATRNRYRGHVYIDRGISEQEFNAYISQIRIAILPHRNYIFRGSGLAAILAGSGATILAFKSNSFFKDIASYSIIDELDKLFTTRNAISSRLDQELSAPVIRSNYKSWTQKRWEEFLFYEK
jgi:hypothetical protein